MPRRSALSRFIDALIAAYQRWLSPRKGFRCAHRRRHGGLSCSQFARRAIARAGLGGGWRALRHRFAACAEAAQAMASLRPYAARRGECDPGSGCDGCDSAGGGDGDLDVPSGMCRGFSNGCLSHLPIPDGCCDWRRRRQDSPSRLPGRRPADEARRRPESRSW